MHHDVQDRMINRARNLNTSLNRLQELAPRLLQVLPDTIGGCADSLSASRQEIQDTAEFALEQIAYRDGRLVLRDGRLSRWDAENPFYLGDHQDERR